MFMWTVMLSSFWTLQNLLDACVLADKKSTVSLIIIDLEIIWFSWQQLLRWSPSFSLNYTPENLFLFRTTLLGKDKKINTWIDTGGQSFSTAASQRKRFVSEKKCLQSHRWARELLHNAFAIWGPCLYRFLELY